MTLQALSLASAGDAWPTRVLAVSSRSGAGLETAIAALDPHRAEEGRPAGARHRQAEGWIADALRDRFGRQGLARLATLGFDLTLAPGAQPFERLRELGAALEAKR